MSRCHICTCSAKSRSHISVAIALRLDGTARSLGHPCSGRIVEGTVFLRSAGLSDAPHTVLTVCALTWHHFELGNLERHDRRQADVFSDITQSLEQWYYLLVVLRGCGMRCLWCVVLELRWKRHMLKCAAGNGKKERDRCLPLFSFLTFKGLKSSAENNHAQTHIRAKSAPTPTNNSPTPCW